MMFLTILLLAIVWKWIGCWYYIDKAKMQAEIDTLKFEIKILKQQNQSSK